MAELSIIIPYCGEFPQLLFTIQSIAQELRDRCDFEIIAINNYCDEVKAQGRDEDKGFEVIEASAKVNPWLKSLHYAKKLSHWQAKNMGVQASSGRFLWFCDAHCIIGRNTLYKMLEYYTAMHEELNGTLHLPLTYKILESHKTMYKLVYKPEIGEVHYSLTGYRQEERYTSYRVPCASSCGCMMTRNYYNKLGGWPKVLTSYGGGENFLNFVTATMGKAINMFNADPLFHHGEKRGYSWNYDGYTTNRISATYMFGGERWAKQYTRHRKGNPEVNNKILNHVISSGKKQREMIKKQQVVSIEDWVKQMAKTGLYQSIV